MYRDLREVFWWNGMKRDIADFCNIQKTSRLN
ncbi:hypothetical protein MTR67_017319 [Solanum verrucosum]|uniref:Integrase zinc-binding domain-containing protein n=1 Tax=Solanum verrucosum TaxID=315347 RepID=A0AAF0TLQ5_SOLVR|nr:hypothetical protein MTR67_017319 [Solanum verrucosum]